jgi:hypothetical protein
VNLGIEPVMSVLFNLAPIWIVLEFFSSYFSDAQYGNPFLEVYEQTERLKETFCQQDASVRTVHSKNTDFPFRLRRPLVVVPGSSSEMAATCVRLESQTGVFI